MRIPTLLLTAALAGSTLSTSHAATIVSDNFDGYANQAAFEAVWPAIGTTGDLAKKSAQLSTTQATSVPNSVFVPVSTTATAALTEFRNRRSFAETSTLASSGNLGIGDTITWSFDFYDSITGGNPQRNYANLQDTTAPGGTNQLVSMGFNNNQTGANSGGQFYMARILGYTVPTVDPDGGPNESVTGASIYFKLNDFGTGARSLGWHNLKVLLSTDDGLSTDYAFYVDNVLAERVNNVGTAASIRSFDNIVIGSGLTNSGVNAYFDNMSLDVTQAVVPEPATMALLCLSCVSLLAARKRRV